MKEYFTEIILALTVLSALIVPDVLLPLQWAITLTALIYRERVRLLMRDDTPEVLKFREDLKDLKAKVDAMIIGGRHRG